MSSERDRMRKRTIMNWVMDKSVLIILSVIILSVLVTFIYVMNNNVGMSDGWVIFILFCVLYVVMVNYGSYSIIMRKRRKIMLFGLLCSIQAIAIILMFLLFYFNLIKLPEKGIVVYGVAFTGLAMLTVIVCSILVKKVK